jgi:hypothetical protein
LPEDLYPEAYPTEYLGTWQFRSLAPAGDWFDSVRVAAPDDPDAPYRMGINEPGHYEPGSWDGQAAPGGVEADVNIGEPGVYAVQTHLAVSGDTQTTFVYAAAGTPDHDEPTRNAAPVKIDINTAHWDIMAVPTQAGADDFIDQAAHIPGVNSRPANLSDFIQDIDFTYQRLRRPLNVMLLTHGNVNSFWIGDNDFLRGTGSTTVRLEAAGYGRIKELRIFTCNLFSVLQDPARYPDHVVRELARGMYNPRSTVGPVTINGYTGRLGAIDNGWSWQQLQRDAFTTRTLQSNYVSYTYPEVLPAPTPLSITP